MDCIVHGVTKSRIRLSNIPFLFLSDDFILCLQPALLGVLGCLSGFGEIGFLEGLYP